MKIEVQDLKKGQVIYDYEADNRYKVLEDAECINNTWQALTVDRGDIEVTFYDGADVFDNQQEARKYMNEMAAGYDESGKPL